MRGRSDLKCAFEKRDENSRTFLASRPSSFRDDESGVPVSEGARDARTAVARLGAAVKACKKAEQWRLLFSDLSSKTKRQRKQARKRRGSTDLRYPLLDFLGLSSRHSHPSVT